MDPDACWKELVELAKKYEQQSESDEVFVDTDRMAELVLGLDGWLRSGGFPPAAWRKDARDQV